MNILDYIRSAQEFESQKSQVDGRVPVRLAIVTNFTDDLLKKVLLGLCLHEGLQPEIYQVSYKQYLFELKNSDSGLFRFKPEITFVFFDVNPYINSEFISDLGHTQETLTDLDGYCSRNSSTVVIGTIMEPKTIQFGRVFRNSNLIKQIRSFNNGIFKLAEDKNNIFVCDTNLLGNILGEKNIRDFRGLFAFKQPFSHDFILTLTREWMAFVRTLKGKVRKCIVLDLDNTLWGGVVGELGPQGIMLGQEYPGNAYLEFQRLLLSLYENGIILAINSKNNPEDVEEVFAKNPNMILRKNHFGAIVANWNNKADNLKTIANELNIGTDSLIFLDDDALNRDLVRSILPEVLVPDFSLPPEEYVQTLLNLDVFHAMRITEEDRERGQMYAAERERKEIKLKTTDISQYLQNLNIEIAISLNDKNLIPRLSQLTQKTNQFNLTTIRSTEKEIEEWINKGWYVYSGDVKDKFGPYGITILAIFEPLNKNKIRLVTYLMSCRVMGRGVEQSFFRSIAEELSRHKFTHIEASFVPTKKNMPAAEFLPSLSATQLSLAKSGAIEYELNIKEYIVKVMSDSSYIKIIK